MLIALSVTKFGAPTTSVVAVTVRAATSGSGTSTVAYSGSAAPTVAALRVAVEVVARCSAAVFGVINFPPSSGDGSGRACVHSRYGAAEFGISRGAQSVGAADRGVRRGGAEEKFERVHNCCGTNQCCTAKKSTSTEAS